MKKFLLICSLASGLAFSGCDKNSLNIKVDMQGTDITFTLKPVPTPMVVDFTEQNVTYNVDSLAKKHGIDKSKIESIKAKEVWFDMLDANNTTFDVINFVEAYVSMPGGTEKKIAFKNPVVKNGTRSLKMDVDTEVELKDYINSPSLNFRVKGSTNAPVLNEVPMKVRITYTMVGNPLN